MKKVSAVKQWLNELVGAKTWRDRKKLRQDVVDNPRILKDLEKLNDKTINAYVDRLFNHPFDSFEPRPDKISQGDEQTGFYESNKLVSIAIGGNGSGKTFVAAQKVAEFLRTTPPPFKDTPFWIISNTYEQVCSTAWFQKLKNILPAEWVDTDRISWYNTNRQWPFSVPLHPQKPGTDKNWIIEFKSYEQGRELMQAAAIGGAWFTEQFPYDVFEEVLRGVRECAFPGSIICEQTPIDPEKAIRLQEIYQHWTVGDERFKNWSFYHLNTESAMNAGHVDKAWYDTFFAGVSDEMMETRKKGVFATYEGVVYKTFSPKVHLVDSIVIPDCVFFKRSIDWGSSEEHPFVCLWGFKDATGIWYIFDEYWSNSQTYLWKDHAAEIKRRKTWEQDGYHLQTYGDPSRPDLFREFASFGIYMTAANNAVYEGIESVRKVLRKDPRTDTPGIIIDRNRCPKLARQMSTYRWEKSSQRGLNPRSARPVPLKFDDDSVDALRYMIHTDRTGEGMKMTPLIIKGEMGKGVKFSR